LYISRERNIAASSPVCAVNPRLEANDGVRRSSRHARLPAPAQAGKVVAHVNNLSGARLDCEQTDEQDEAKPEISSDTTHPSLLALRDLHL